MVEAGKGADNAHTLLRRDVPRFIGEFLERETPNHPVTGLLKKAGEENKKYDDDYKTKDSQLAEKERTIEAKRLENMAIDGEWSRRRALRTGAALWRAALKRGPRSDTTQAFQLARCR